MPKSEILLTIDHPIPTWKGPLENGIPEILTISANPPPISGADDAIIDFHCADTFLHDGGVINFEKTLGTIIDDQT